MSASKVPKTINLLEPVNPPEDVWESIYDWLFNVGKYLLISVEIVVLLVFFSRFVIDRKNNDLTDEINSQVDVLSNTYYRLAEIKFNNLHTLFGDLKTLDEDQEINSAYISSVQESIPSDLELQRFSYSKGQVSMAFIADNFEEVQSYESSLRNNQLYQNIQVTLSKSGEGSSKIDFAVTFQIKSSSN